MLRSQAKPSRNSSLAVAAALSCMAIVVFGLSHSLPALCESNVSLLKQAITEYRTGDYTSSAGHFYAVLTTEFNNPQIHYYMASCYAHMKDTESAVREFRIAYALAPQTQVGYFASKALKIYGVNRTEGAPLKTLMEDSLRANPKAAPDPSCAAAPAPPPIVGPPSVSDQSISLIKSQLEKEKSSKLEQSHRMADQIANQRDDRMDKLVTAAGGNLSADPKQRERDILSLPDDVKSLLNKLKQEYDGRTNSQLGLGKQQSEMLEQSAANLQDLIERHHSVDAAGSNLYVRNYKTKTESTK
jgi:tetratricopeptide (TPR) repeat protein